MDAPHTRSATTFVVHPLPNNLSARPTPSSTPSHRRLHYPPLRRPPSATLPETTVRAQSNTSPSGLPTSKVRVTIQAPESNRRLISACNLIHAPLQTVWDLLSDYSNLSTHIPNLVVSKQTYHPSGGIRVVQSGAQTILGFQFRASLTMDMNEVNSSSAHWRAINFDLVSSRDFRQFEGVWRMERVDPTTTALFYTVSIIPKGLVPVRAIEWRIAEDVPQNMDAVRRECERRRRVAVAAARRQQFARANKTQSQ